MRTKQLLGLAIGILSAVGAQAQNNSMVSGPSQLQRDFISKSVISNAGVFSTEANSNFNYNEEKYRKFKKMRTAGIVLTSAGAALIGTGTVLINAAEKERGGNDYINNNNGADKALAGVLSIFLGTLSTGGGITMWVIGNNKMKKYGGGRVMVQPAKNGVGLAYKF